MTNTKPTFYLSPSQRETIHRVLGKEAAAATFHSAQDTGGGVMNDLYLCADNRVLCIHEYGAILYPSMDAWNNSSETWGTCPQFSWDDEGSGLFLGYTSFTTESLINLWADNCELIFGELGSADEMLLEHGANISPEEFAWVEAFIEEWDEVQEEELEAFDAAVAYRGEA